MATAMIPLSESSTNVTEVEIAPSPDHGKRRRCKGSECIKSPRKRVILLCVVVAIIAVTVGWLLGYFVPRLLKDACDDESWSAVEDVDDKFANKVSTKELENSLR